MSEDKAQYTVHPDVSIRLEVAERHIKHLESTNDGLTMVIGRHAETITQQVKRIAELKQVIRDTEDDLAATITAQAARIAKLEAQIAAMPVDAMRRYHLFTHYDVHAANDVGYTTQQFDSDDEDIRLWLTSLDGDA